MEDSDTDSFNGHKIQKGDKHNKTENWKRSHQIPNIVKSSRRLKNYNLDFLVVLWLIMLRYSPF